MGNDYRIGDLFTLIIDFIKSIGTWIKPLVSNFIELPHGLIDFINAIDILNWFPDLPYNITFLGLLTLVSPLFLLLLYFLGKIREATL